MDADLDALSREQLIIEIKQLRGAIRQHRDSSGHDLCWHHPALWSLLPEKMVPAVAVPAWPQPCAVASGIANLLTNSSQCATR